MASRLLCRRYDCFRLINLNSSSKLTNISPIQRLSLAVPSISEQEKQKFRQLANKWWSGPEMLPLRTMNHLRVPFITESFMHRKEVELDQTKPLKDIKLLDIGSGGGLLSEPLARLGAQVVGLDPVEESVLVAREHCREMATPPEYVASTIEDFARDESNVGKFDGVIASEVLEHVDNIESFLSSSLACLRPNGYLFITSINQTPIAYLTAILFAENVLGVVPKGTHEYDKLVSPQALSLVLEQDFGCSVLKIHGMLFNPISFDWSWSRLQEVNYALMAVKRAQ